MAKMKSRKKVIILVAVLAVLVIGIAVALVSCGGTSTQERMQAMAQMMNSMNTTASALERTDLANTVSVSGNVRSANVKKVYLEATGAGKAMQVNVKVGDVVKAGDVLCTFDTEKLQKEYDKLKLQADQSAERAQISLQSAENSYATGKITQDQAVRAAQDNVDLMQEQLDAANEAYLDAVDAYNKGELEYTLETDYNYTMATYEYKTIKNELHELLNLKSSAESGLGDLENGEELKENAVAMLDAQIAAKQMELDAAKEAMDAARKLFESKDIDSEKVLDDYKEAVADAQEAYDAAVQRFEEAEKQRKLSLSSASGNIDNAEIGTDMTLTQMSLDDALENIEKCTVTAPVTGTVTAVYVTEGESNQAGSMLFIIEDLSDLEIKTTVKEYDVAALAIGMPVQVKSDATGSTVYEGTVEEIGVTAQKDAYGNTINASTAEFDLTISVKPGDGKLKVGMNARATITIEGKQDVLAVLYSAVGYDKDGSAYVYAVKKDEDGNNIARKIYVDTGVESDYEIEILSDELNEGDLILDNPEGVTDGQLMPYVG